MGYRLRKLAEYIRGWMGYFRITEYYRSMPLLDQWIRRRLETPGYLICTFCFFRE